MADNGDDSEYEKIAVFENDLALSDTSECLDGSSSGHERIPKPDAVTMAGNGDDSDYKEFVVVIENGVVISEKPGPAQRQKRIPKPDTWRMNIVKKLRNEGKAYISRKSNKLVEARKIGPPCANGCFERITMPVIEALFKEFWALGDYNAQTSYLLNLLSWVPIKRHRTPDKKKNRTKTVVYHVMYGGVQHGVCKKGFCSIFGISDRRVRVALERSEKGEPTEGDRRGKNPRVTKFVGAKADLVRTHIKMLPTMSSQCHYCAKSGDRVYLDSNLNIVKLHQMYMDFMKDKHPDVETVSFNYYSNVFRNEFDIGFMPPVITCITCGLLIAENNADRDSQRTGPSNVLSPSSSSFAENSGASTEQAKKRPAAKAKGTQRNQKEEANDIEFGDEVKTKEHEKAPRGRPKKGSSSKSSSSKRKRTSSDKSKETLQKEDEEEKEDGVKKLKVEEERLEEREELEGELEEKPDSLDMIPFQEIKIEEEDPLSAPYPLDDEDNIPEAPGVDLPSRGFFKLEQLSWTDKTDEDKNSIAVAEGDSSKKENKSGRSRKAKAVSKSKESSKEKISEGTEETLKKNPKKQKVDKQQEVNKQQEKLSPEELSKRRYRKILREDSQSELSELSLQLTRDIYDVFGMHVAKTLRDINDIKVFNRVKIKINEILLDALAGYYLNPAFERETSVGTKIPPQDHKSSENTQPSIHCDDSLNQGLEKKTHVTKCSSSPNKDIHKTSLDIDQTQPVSIDQSSCTSQHSMIPETVRIINPPLIIPVNPSQSETSQTRTENPYINTSQDSRTLETTPSIYQPGTILVNFSFPVIPQSNVVGDSRTLETTQSIYQPGIIPLSASFPVIAQSSPAIAQGSAVDDSRTLVTTQSIHQPGTILENSSCPDTARSSVLNPNGNRSQHSRITETSHDTDIRASDPNVTRTRPVDSPSSSSQHSRSTKTSHDTDVLASDPNVTRTRPVDSPSSSSQHDGLSETAARGVDAAQTSAVDPTGSISQHSGIPVTAHDKTHHPKVPGKSKKKKTDLNPLQS